MSHLVVDYAPVIPVVTAIALFILGVKIVKYILAEENAQIHDSSKSHYWKSIPFLQSPRFCNICENLMITGEASYCDSCGICCDIGCIAAANKTLCCKVISEPNNEQIKHHWVKGNVSPLSSCGVCSSTNGIQSYKCCWCQRSVHNQCRSNVPEVCDFGSYKLMIIPPMSVEVVRKRNSMRRRLVLKSVTNPDWPDWSPLIVIANCKSGGSSGEDVMSLFRGVLNPAQVVDLGQKQPRAALDWCVKLENTKCRILVAGGDGTIGWILNTIHEMNLPNPPPLAIIPLGTGNDLSRVMGWGKAATGNIQPTEVLENIAAASEVEFDRWQVTIKPFRSLRIKGSSKDLFMYNYLSIGVDAQVTYDFHRTRESPFYIFSSRLVNKLLYLGYGTQQIIEKRCQGLNNRLELFLDGKKVELPDIESVVVLNIDSWGAGVRLWEMGEGEENDIGDDEQYSPQSYNDGVLEVLALYSSLHIAQLQVGLSLPYRVGQAKCVEIKLNALTAVQVDGEPWLQHPAEFTIKLCNKAKLLTGNITS